MTVNDRQYLHLQRGVSYMISIEKKGFKLKNIDIRDYRKNINPAINDTTDLGDIYLEK